MQNTKLIKKISTSLVSTGEIIDSLQSNSSTSAPSIRAVVDNMTPPQNLLINGDFKINQRGQSSYEINNSTWIYSIDLWRINGMKLQVNGDGTITLTALNEVNYFQQIVENANYQTGDKLVLSLYIDGSIKVFNIQIGTTDYVDEKISIFASYNEEQKKIYLSLSLNKQSDSVTLKYMRLNEGTVVYHHVPEDDVIALMRCQEWVYGLITGDYARLPLGHLSSNMIQVPLPFINLKSYATVIMDGNFDIRCIYPNWWNIAYVGSITEATFIYSSKMFQFTKPSLSGSPDSGQVFSIESQPGARIIITCEPV